MKEDERRQGSKGIPTMGYVLTEILWGYHRGTCQLRLVGGGGGPLSLAGWLADGQTGRLAERSSTVPCSQSRAPFPSFHRK